MFSDSRDPVDGGDEVMLHRVCVQVELVARRRGERHHPDLHVPRADVERLREPGHEIELLLEVDGPQ